VQRHPVHRGGHGVLADAEVHLHPPRMRVGLGLDAGPEVDAGVAREVTGTGDQARDPLSGRCQALVDGFARGQLGAGLEGREAVGPSAQTPAAKAGLEPVPVLA
jgi:hypothetical protein